MYLGRLPLHWGSTHPRAGWGLEQPNPHLAVSNPLCGVSPPRAAQWLACGVGGRGGETGVETQGIPSTLQSQTPEPPSLPSCLFPGPAAQFFWGNYTLLLFFRPQSKARPPLLLPPWTLPCSPRSSLLSHLHTAPCTQHHVSKQLTLPRELGGREQGGGKGGVSRKSSLGSRAEALPTPAARGLQAPRLGVCRLALEFPSSHDQIPKNEKLGPGPEEGEGKAKQGGRVAGWQGRAASSDQADGGVYKGSCCGTTLRV